MATVASPIDVERVLALKTVREPGGRAQVLSTMRDLGRDGLEFTLDRLQDLMAVEEHFQALLLYDQIEFLRQAEPLPEPERDFALNVQRICLEAANGFQRFLRNRNAWATSRESLELMFRVTGLALNAIHAFVKWGHFLNESGRTTPWRQLHALYSVAESDGYAQVPFTLHASQPSFRPSVQSLYLRALILDLLNTGNLSKAQIEIADGWFSAWCNEYALDTEYSTRQHLFFVDLSADAGLRIMRRDSHGETMRYVRIDALKAQVEEVQSGLRQGRLYAGFGAGAVFPIEEHVALLATIEKLYQSVAAGSENRIEERTRFEDREVDAIVGFERLVTKMQSSAAPPILAPAGLGETLAISLPEFRLDGGEPPQAAGASAPAAAPEDPDTLRWRVHDLSTRGYGLVVERGMAENVLLNGMIGLRNHQAGSWIVGTVVRKLANRQRGEMLVGVEILAYRPIGVELTPASGGAPIPALFLPGMDTSGKQDALLVRPADFSSENTFLLTTGGDRYTIRLNRIIKKGSDWLKARFEIDSKA
jgi:cyclic-di-GMP-binding protein